MENNNKKCVKKNGKSITPNNNNNSQLSKNIYSVENTYKQSNIVWNRDSAPEAPSSASANNTSGTSVNPVSIIQKLREELTKDVSIATAVHRLPVQPAPYKRVAQEASHQNKPASPTPTPAPVRNARASISHKPSTNVSDPRSEHPTIMCIVNGINVTVDEARTLLNSYTSPQTLVTEKGKIVYTDEQLAQLYAQCGSFHMQIVEISTNNKRNLLKKIETRKLEKNTEDRSPPLAYSPDSSQRLVIDEADVPASLSAHSLPPAPSALRMSPHLSSRRNSLPQTVAYFHEPVASTTSNENIIVTNECTSTESPDLSSKNINAVSAGIYQPVPSKAVKRSAIYDELLRPPRKVSVTEYRNSDYSAPGNRERPLYRVQQQNRNSLPIYESISPAPGQYGPQRVDYTEYGVNYDERKQFYGPIHPLWRDNRLNSVQHNEIMHPMLQPPAPYYVQKPRFIQPSGEMRHSYAVPNPQEVWYSPPLNPNTEQGVSHFYSRAAPVSDAQINLLAKQHSHYQHQRTVRYPGEPYFPV